MVVLKKLTVERRRIRQLSKAVSVNNVLKKIVIKFEKDEEAFEANYRMLHWLFYSMSCETQLKEFHCSSKGLDMRVLTGCCHRFLKGVANFQPEGAASHLYSKRLEVVKLSLSLFARRSSLRRRPELAKEVLHYLSTFPDGMLGEEWRRQSRRWMRLLVNNDLYS